jgi:hypothetical protein
MFKRISVVLVIAIRHDLNLKDPKRRLYFLKEIHKFFGSLDAVSIVSLVLAIANIGGVLSIQFRGCEQVRDRI